LLVALVAASYGNATLSAVAGFGGGELILPVFFAVFGARDAVAVLTVAQLTSNSSRVWFNRREIDHRLVTIFAAGAVPAAVAGPSFDYYAAARADAADWGIPARHSRRALLLGVDCPSVRGKVGTLVGRRSHASGRWPRQPEDQRAAPGRADAKGTTMNVIFARLAAASGAFYVIAVMVGGALMESGSAAVARASYALAVLGFTAFVVFVGFMHRILRLAEGPDGWVATVALGAGLLHSAVRFEAQAPRMVGLYRGDGLSPELARTLEDLNGAAFVVTGLLLGLYAASAGWMCLKHRLLPRWLGWFGEVAGVLAVVAGVAGIVDPGGYIPLPFVAGLVWTMVVSILLTVHPRRSEAEPTQPVQTATRTDAAGAV
jgi:hypothetical protein